MLKVIASRLFLAYLNKDFMAFSTCFVHHGGNTRVLGFLVGIDDLAAS